MLKNVREGKLHIEVEDKQNEKLSKKIDQASNRFFLSIIIAALIIGSALTMNIEVDSANSDSFHYLSIIELCAAGLLLLYLLFFQGKSSND